MAEVTDSNPKGAGAPQGNKNSSKDNRLFANTIKRILVQEDDKGVRIRAVATALIEKAQSGDVGAIRELADRVDGKVTQPIEGDIDHTLNVTITRFTDEHRPSE